MNYSQAQVVEVANFAITAIGVVIAVVMVAWGFSQVRKAVRGEPMEEPPIPLPEF